MKIAHRLVDTALVVTLEGNLIEAEAIQLEDYILPLVEKDSIDKLVINFEKIEGIDSIGLGVLMYIFKKLAIPISLCHLNSHIKDTLDATGFSEYIGIYPSEAEALKA